jgi:hypothetical protein
MHALSLLVVKITCDKECIYNLKNTSKEQYTYFAVLCRDILLSFCNFLVQGTDSVFGTAQRLACLC